MKWLLVALGAALVAAVVGYVIVGDAGDESASCASIRSNIEAAADESGRSAKREDEWFAGVSLEDAERCDVLQGLSREQVGRVVGLPLHRRERDDESWLFVAGETSGTFGPPDSTYLVISFGPRSDRVMRTDYP